MKNTFENPTMPPTEGVKIERTEEQLKLIETAKTEAKHIIDKARGMTGIDRIETEKEAYRIYAALDILKVDLDPSIINTIKNQIDKGMGGFGSNPESAEDFLREVVGESVVA